MVFGVDRVKNSKKRFFDQPKICRSIYPYMLVEYCQYIVETQSKYKFWDGSCKEIKIKVLP